ncbi:MAG: HAMP domain-containing sensor histidine kinase [Rhodocyclaceae bacterium]|nr:HAMP domain-containing sensor histidine kinase [Rhodocyclaceae bacterium]
MKFSPALARFAITLAGRRRWLLLGLLALLHMVLLQGPGDPLSQVLFVAHLGLFILWQPFIRAEQRISPLALLLMVGAVLASAIGLGWWLLGIWLMLLAGIVGGKVFLFEARWSKIFYLLALAYLVVALLLLVLPQLMPAGLRSPTEPFALLARFGLPALLLLMAFLPEEKEADGQAEVVDFVYSVFIFLLLAVLAMGSMALMLLGGHDYAESLLMALLVIGTVLLILGWVWNPRIGFAGIGTVFSRYLLSIGLPVERWLHALADLAQRQDDPEAFVAEACADMAQRLPWVTGGDWTSGTRRGEFGSRGGQRSEFRYDGLTIGIYTRHALSPSLLWHFNLLAQLVGEFHADKVRARQLDRLTYVQAIHETGARLTHDVKNLLQSLRTLCAAAGDARDEPAPEFIALLRRQLPAIAQRLGQTLEKLQAPGRRAGECLDAASWWESIRRRYAGRGIEFVAEGGIGAGVQVPAPLFDNVAENLLENAIDKRRLATGLRISITLQTARSGAELEVCDDGEAIPAALATDLLHIAVRSENGLGIGLYQAARLAEANGHELMLAGNRPGQVCFRLAPAQADAG